MTNIGSIIRRWVRSFCSLLPAGGIRLIERIYEFSIKQKYYTNSNQRMRDTSVICIVSGWFNNGGLTDRINGIISAYYAAEKSGRKFKLLFDEPFNLTDYLIPNKVDWHINTNDIIYGVNSKPIFLRAFNRCMSARLEQLVKIAKHYNHKQLHVFTNVVCADNEIYHKYFHRLFKPSERLDELIKLELKRIGERYISVTFRFQQLLGDFQEGNFPTLATKEALKLINDCVLSLEYIHLQNNDKIIVVTSDSITFLNIVKKFEYVKIIPGKVVHMQYDNNKDFLVHAKAFVDLYVIANAEKIYLVVNPPMHDSGFPKFASKIYLHPFYKVCHIGDDN